MEKPALSILLPVYNHGHYLGQALESVLNQSFADFEILVINDGSTDHTGEIIEKYAQLDSRVKPVIHAQNCGIAEAVASGLRAAQGHYLHGLSATDCYLPGFLQRSMEMLLKYPQIGLSFTDAGHFTGDVNNYKTLQLIPNAPSTLVFPAHKIERVFKYAHLSIPGLCAVIKKTSFIKYGGYRRELHFMCDGFLNQQIALFEGAIYIPEPLILYREPEYSKQSSQKPTIRKEALHNLKELILRPENSELLHRMKKAALLGILCKEEPWQCFQHTRLWPLYWDLSQRYIYKRLRALCGKPLVSVDFLRRHSLT